MNLYEPVKKEEDKQVTMTLKLPVSMRDAFKAHCDKHNIEMSVVIRRFMEGELSKVQPT